METEPLRLPRQCPGLFEFARPLRSVRITRTSSLLRDGPPPASASLLSPFTDYRALHGRMTAHQREMLGWQS